MEGKFPQHYMARNNRQHFWSSRRLAEILEGFFAEALTSAVGTLSNFG